MPLVGQPRSLRRFLCCSPGFWRRSATQWPFLICCARSISASILRLSGCLSVWSRRWQSDSPLDTSWLGCTTTRPLSSPAGKCTTTPAPSAVGSLKRRSCWMRKKMRSARHARINKGKLFNKKRRLYGRLF